jgi:uncharacterized protein (DUF697 family)
VVAVVGESFIGDYCYRMVLLLRWYLENTCWGTLLRLLILSNNRNKKMERSKDMSRDSIIEYVEKQIQKALDGKLTQDEKAGAIIVACITINAGMGLAPFGVNILSFMAVSSVMVASIAQVYERFISFESAAEVVKKILFSAGWVYAANVLGWKVIIEIAKVAGIATAGAVTGVAMAVDAVLFSAVTYAIGYTSKEYFKKDGKMSDEALGKLFKKMVKEGKKRAENK